MSNDSENNTGIPGALSDPFGTQSVGVEGQFGNLGTLWEKPGTFSFRNGVGGSHGGESV